MTILASAVGYDGEKETLNIIDCDQGKVSSGIIKNIPVQKDTKIEIQITLDRGFAGQTDMVCHLRPENKSVFNIIKSKLAI